MDQRQFDKELKQMFQNIGDHMEPPEDLYLSVQRKIKSKEEYNMKNFLRTRKMKGFVIAAAICVVSISCYAASKSAGFFSSSSEKLYTPPTVSEMKKSVGFAPKYVESFENGYTFKYASPGETEARDENGETLGMFKDMAFFYKNESYPDSYISLNAHEVTPLTQTDENMGEAVALDGGFTGNYEADEYRFYPPDQKPTEADLKLEAEGKLYISYGSDKVETVHFQHLQWEHDGIDYMITISNGNFTKEQVVAMANKVIAK